MPRGAIRPRSQALQPWTGNASDTSLNPWDPLRNGKRKEKDASRSDLLRDGMIACNPRSGSPYSDTIMKRGSSASRETPRAIRFRRRTPHTISQFQRPLYGVELWESTGGPWPIAVIYWRCKPPSFPAQKNNGLVSGAIIFIARCRQQPYAANNAFIFFSAFASSWRMRSAETPYSSASSCSVAFGSPRKRRLRISRERASRSARPSRRISS